MDEFSYEATHLPFPDKVLLQISEAYKKSERDARIGTMIADLEGTSIPESMRDELVRIALKYLSEVLLDRDDLIATTPITRGLADQVGSGLRDLEGSLRQLQRICSELELDLQALLIGDVPMLARKRALRLLSPRTDIESLMNHPQLIHLLMASGVHPMTFALDEYRLDQRLAALALSFYPADTSGHRLECVCPVCNFKRELQRIADDERHSPAVRLHLFLRVLEGMPPDQLENNAVRCIVRLRLWNWALAVRASDAEWPAHILRRMFDQVIRFQRDEGVINPQVLSLARDTVGEDWVLRLIDEGWHELPIGGATVLVTDSYLASQETGHLSSGQIPPEEAMPPTLARLILQLDVDLELDPDEGLEEAERSEEDRL